MANVVVSAIATFNGKALKKGQKEISAFDKQAQKLGKTFTKVFATAALVNFGRNSVNAFIESEKAAAKLRTTVTNLGLEFEQPAIEKYLDNLSLQFGIVDENLIPGFQRLLTVTKDVAQAQSLFDTALNVAAGSGKDLTAVSTSLSKAYLGDNAALGRLGVGLSKAQLKSASFLELQNTLNANFAGQAAAAVEGYAGSMAKLTVAVDKSKEAIGKGLLDALAALSASKDIDTFTTKMVNAAEKIGSAFATLGDVLGLLNPNAAVKVGGKFVRRSDVMNQNQGGYSGIPDIRTTQALTKARKEEFKIITKKNAIENKNVEELKKKFDLERIGINAALNNATDEETKLRLKSQLAILDNNEALAKKYLAELEATEALRKLAEQAKLAGMSLEDFALFKVKSLNTKIDDYLQNTALEMVRALNAQIAAFIASLGGVKTPTSTAAPTYSYALSTAQATNEKIAAFENKVAMESTQDLNSRINQFLSQNAQRTTAQAPMDIRLTIDGGSDKLSQAIAESIQVATRSGYSTVPNGFIV
jgi:hypothetical protein